MGKPSRAEIQLICNRLTREIENLIKNGKLDSDRIIKVMKIGYLFMEKVKELERKEAR